ncbi:MAG: glycosyltransferase family 4 protein [Candidatus Magnetominusculus sp. LBB02]|nr:glycosyltransferase family 4 protein [Candidatus Magnetominusculus sp. LBB02]
MRVCFYRYSLRNRGGDRAVIEYANHLAVSGYDVTFCLNVLDTVFALEPSIKIKYIKLPTPIGTILSGAIRRLPYDIVFVDIIHLAVPLGLRNRVIYLAQAYDSLYYETKIQQAAVDLLYRIYYSRREAFSISISEMLTAILKEKFGAGHDKLKTVVLGIDHRRFFYQRDDALIREKHGRAAIVVLSRGDVFRKGFDITITVLNDIAAEMKDKAEVWVCGSPVEFKLKTRQFGRPQDEELRRILSSADVFLYPSRHEGFGLFPLEAMACGLPVLTTPTVSFVTGGYDAFISEPNAEAVKRTLLSALSNHELRNTIKENGLITAKKYDIAKSKQEFEGIIAAVR